MGSPAATSPQILLSLLIVACGFAFSQAAEQWIGPYTPKDLAFGQRMLIVIAATFLVRLALNFQNGKLSFKKNAQDSAATALYGPLFLIVASPFAPVLSNSATIGIDYLAALATGSAGSTVATWVAKRTRRAIEGDNKKSDGD